MKKLLVVAAIAIAGCAARTPEQKPATPDQRAGTPRTVEVATFTAEVDPVARTVQLNSQPTAAGRALGLSRLVEITSGIGLANTVNDEGITQVYFNVPQNETDRVCNNGHDGPVWGANVTITNSAPNTTLSNLYVQFTAFSGPPGSEVCNSLEAPPADITDLGLGLWSSPVMVGGEVTQDWTFSFVDAGRFTFAGRILASVTELFPIATYPAGGYGIIANGTGVVYSALDTPRLAFLEPGAGGTWNQFLSKLLPGYAWALARDGAHGGKIWYTTDSSLLPSLDYVSYVGFVRIDDHGSVGGSIDLPGTTTIAMRPWSIKVDPDVTLPQSRAWFVASDFDYSVSDYVGASLGYVDADLTGTGISAPTWFALDATLARSLVFAENDNIYVTLAPTIDYPFGAIQRCTKTGCLFGDLLDTPDVIPLPSNCETPDDIIYEPVTGKLWFTVGVNTPGGGVCTLDPFALDAVTRVAEAPYPGYLALGPAGEVWVGEYASGDGVTDRMQRIVEGDVPFYVSTDLAPVFGTVWNADRLWVVTQDGVNRINP